MTETENNDEMTKFIIDGTHAVDCKTRDVAFRISGTARNSFDPRTISDGAGNPFYRMRENHKLSQWHVH